MFIKHQWISIWNLVHRRVYKTLRELAKSVGNHHHGYVGGPRGYYGPNDPNKGILTYGQTMTGSSIEVTSPQENAHYGSLEGNLSMKREGSQRCTNNV